MQVRPQYVDFFAERLRDATDDLLTALTAFKYEEAVEVVEWINKEIRLRAVVRKGVSASVARDFPVKINPYASSLARNEPEPDTDC